MSNRYYQQFFFSPTRKLTGLHGLVNIVQAVKATLVNQGVTYTAQAFGTSGNDITITIVGGGTAGSEVVTVDGNAITIEVEAGVSTVTQVVAAVDGEPAAFALVDASGAAATTINAVAETPLAGGIDGVASSTIVGASVARTGVGAYTITLEDTFNALMSANFTLQAAVAVDLVPQILSVDVTSAKTIVVRLLAGATPTEVAAACVLHCNILLRNSSVVL